MNQLDVKLPRTPNQWPTEDDRLATFTKWPFDAKSKCNAKAMAQAGFVYSPDGESDSVRCFICAKELDGWDPNDDPWEEHRSHASYCLFAKIGKPESELLVSEFIDCLAEYYKAEHNRISDTFIKQQKDRLQWFKENTRNILKHK